VTKDEETQTSSGVAQVLIDKCAGLEIRMCCVMVGAERSHSELAYLHVDIGSISKRGRASRAGMI
jgi:hypothetical protein